MSLQIVYRFKTDSEREQGLRGKILKNNELALFIFPKEKTVLFWNKGVSYNIDIAFFDKNFKLLKIDSLKANQTKNISCENTKYVLESNENILKENLKDVKFN